MAERQKVWVLKSEYIDCYEDTIIGIFPSKRSAINHLFTLLTEEIRNDEDGYDDWVYTHKDESDEECSDECSDGENGKDLSMKAYIKEGIKELEERIREYKNGGGDHMEWGINLYTCIEVPSYL